MKLLFLLLLLSLVSNAVVAQKTVADSLAKKLQQQTTDSGRTDIMWQMANAVSMYNPEQALVISQRALYLAENIKYVEGQSRSLGVVANTFIKLGNYPRALEYHIRKLKLEEKRNNPRNLASALMNIGVVYIFQEDYKKSLAYYAQSDSLINKYNLSDLKYYSALNLGDVYNRMGSADTAYTFFNKALQIATAQQDGDFIGAALTGLGHTYVKRKNYEEALNNYRPALQYLTAANDNDILCEAMLGMAKLFQQTNKRDSAIYYAKKAGAIALADGFQNWELQSAAFLADQYKQQQQMDSAFRYLSYVQIINDSLNSKTRIREAQIITSNEQLRQLELEENRKLAKKERETQLQLLFIAIFIPAIFIFSILLSRIHVHPKIIRVLGVISLLFLFEYLTLLLHPYVKELTHHTPVYEILIFVAIAAILIPAHHKIEHWFLNKLTSGKVKNEKRLINIKTIRLKFKR